MSKFPHKLILLILLAFALPAGISLTYAQKGDVLIRIGVTTDVHGAYFPADWNTGKQIPGSLAQVSAWAREQRKTLGENLILLDNGDLIQGDPAS